MTNWKMPLYQRKGACETCGAKPKQKCVDLRTLRAGIHSPAPIVRIHPGRPVLPPDYKDPEEVKTERVVTVLTQEFKEYFADLLQPEWRG